MMKIDSLWNFRRFVAPVRIIGKTTLPVAMRCEFHWRVAYTIHHGVM